MATGTDSVDAARGLLGARATAALDAIAASRRAALQPGEYLDGPTSLAVYTEAAAAFTSCAACAGLESTCLRPGKEDAFWPLFDAAHEAVCETAAPKLPPPLTRFVHAVANQQKRASAAWRARAAASLAEVPGLSQLGEAEAQSALQEVAELTASVRSISSAARLTPAA